MAKSLRVGIVGCGSIARSHLRAYQAQSQVQVALVYDAIATAAEAFAVSAGASVAPSLEAMASAGLDAVSICTPPSAHPENAQIFLDAGIAVLCEKPLAVDLPAATAMAAMVQRSGTPFMIAYCHRFHPPIRRIKDLLASGKLGTPLLMRNLFGGYIDLKGNHRLDPKLSGGGTLVDNTSHSIDLFRFLVGEPTQVQAICGNPVQDLPVEDFAMVHLSCAGKSFGELSSSYSLRGGRNTIELYCSKGAAVVNYWVAGQSDLSCWFEGEKDWQAVDVSAEPDRFVREIGQFLEGIRSGGPLPTSVADGLAAARIAAGAYESARTGRAVALPAVAATE